MKQGVNMYSHPDLLSSSHRSELSSLAPLNFAQRLQCFAMLLMLALLGWIGVGNGVSNAQETEKAAVPGSVIKKHALEIESVKPFVSGEWTKRWVEEVARLEKVRPRKIQINDKEILVDESLFYSGRYGSPLSYTRALDLAEKHGFAPAPGAKVFDFGYGSIGHLRMLAQMGLQVTAVDVDPLLAQMYKDSSGNYAKGSVQLLNGKFPAEEELVQATGQGYDLFLSKNTLKRGYIHPAREPASPRHVFDLGVNDQQFLEQVSKMLKPHGLMVIYNFCPPKAPEDKPYVPWADGECPYTKEQLEEAGFEVLEYDVVDNQQARELGRLLGWDAEGGMNLEKDLFAWYTVARKK
jgi:2-polyprenyl-3-methyl-5-hydroxy-6-metoxy-1,4-benzoquinol methylase